MTKFKEIYKCNVCGNIVEVLHAGGGQLVCCGEYMELKQENSQDAATEKHVPVLEEFKDGVKVKVGEIEHPMTEAHYIEWIEIQTEERSYKRFLSHSDKPEAYFPVRQHEIIKLREYCNVHGLWVKR